MNYKAEVRIEYKPGILDAEGKTVKHSLELLGFNNIQEAKSIKLFQLIVNANSEDEAKNSVEDMCKRLLANPVVNNYSISVEASE